MAKPRDNLKNYEFGSQSDLPKDKKRAFKGDDVIVSKFRKAHSDCLCEGLVQFLENEEYTDIQVKVKDKTFQCHKVVLAALSPFFEAMFRSDMKERNDGVVTLQDMEPGIFELVLKYVYSSDDSVVNQTNVDSILGAAEMFQMKGLKEKCEEFKFENVDAENCLVSWKLADSYECKHLAEKAWRFVLFFFEQIWDTDEFLQLSNTDILSIITDNDLKTPNEEIVCDAVLKWLDHDKPERLQHADVLFEHLRFPLMQPEYILDVVDSHEYVTNSTKCKAIVEEAKRYHMLPARRAELVSKRLLHRNNRDYEEVVICIGGNLHPERTTRDVVCYSLKQMEWTSLASLPYDLGVEFAVCSHGNAVFVSGGSVILKGLLYYQTTHSIWVECCPMLTGRRRHCMVAVGDAIYVLGGFDDDEQEDQFSTLASVERYGVMTGNWEDYGYLSVPVRSASASVAQEKICIYGGIGTDGCPTSVVQCFDTRNRSGYQITNLPSGLTGMSSAIVCNKTTFLVFPNGTVLKKEYEDSKSDEIEIVGSIPGFQRCGYSVIQHEDSVVVVGGIDTSEIYDEFVMYDPRTNTTTLSEQHQLLRPLFGFGCVKSVISKNAFR